MPSRFRRLRRDRGRYHSRPCWHLVGYLRASFVHRKSSADHRHPSSMAQRCHSLCNPGGPSQPARIPACHGMEHSHEPEMDGAPERNQLRSIKRSASGCSSTVGMVGWRKDDWPTIAPRADNSRNGTTPVCGIRSNATTVTDTSTSSRNLDKVVSPGNYDSRFRMRTTQDHTFGNRHAVFAYRRPDFSASLHGNDPRRVSPSIGRASFPLKERAPVVIRMYRQIRVRFTTNREELSIVGQQHLHRTHFQWTPGDQHTYSLAAVQPSGGNTLLIHVLERQQVASTARHHVSASHRLIPLTSSSNFFCAPQLVPAGPEP